MERELYLKMWVQGLYEGQETFPGAPMALEDARDQLETIAAHPEDYLTPPDGITPGELMEAWNEAHFRALEWAKEDRERHGGAWKR